MERTLVVLDLNGVFIERVHRTKQTFLKTEFSFLTPNGYYVFIRPYTKRLLAFLFKHFDVAVWSSMNHFNTSLIVERLFSKKQRALLKFVYTQDQCDTHHVPGQEKPVFYKRISKIETDFGYPINNILLVDDSSIKVTFNPPFSAIHPTSYSRDKQRNDCALFRLQQVLEAFLKSDVFRISTFLRNTEHLKNTRLRTNKPPSWWERVVRFFTWRNVHVN